MTWPAMGSVMPRLEAMSGSRPMATNSVVPIAKLPMASAITASQRTDGGGDTTDMGMDGRSRERVTGTTVDALMPFTKPTFVFQDTKVAELTLLGHHRGHGHRGRCLR